MYTLLSSIPVRQTDSNGAVVSGALLYTYAAGTVTPQATYTDGTGSTPLSNPVVADATGLFPAIWTGGLTYDFACYTPGGTLLWEVRSYTGQQTTGAAAWLTVTGTDTIAGSISPGFPAYTTGQLFQFPAAGPNATTTVNLNINGLGPVSILRKGGGALAIGDVVGLIQVYYNGTYFEYINPQHAKLADTATLANTATLATTATSANAGPNVTPFYSRNRIINGNFIIKQDATYASGAAVPAGGYIHDGWKAGGAGLTATWATTGIDAVLTISAGSVVQVIDSPYIEGGTYTMSWTGTAIAQIDGGGFLASPITITGKTGGTTCTVEFKSGTVGLVQFEPGSTASPFERDPRAWDRCLERYWVLAHAVFIPGSQAPGAGYNAAQSIFFPVKMRAAPTISATFSGALNIGSQVVNASSAYGFTLNIVSAGVGNFQSTYSAGNTADARI